MRAGLQRQQGEQGCGAAPPACPRLPLGAFDDPLPGLCGLAGGGILDDAEMVDGRPGGVVLLCDGRGVGELQVKWLKPSFRP